jgi:hypothetical protein
METQSKRSNTSPSKYISNKISYSIRTTPLRRQANRRSCHNLKVGTILNDNMNENINENNVQTKVKKIIAVDSRPSINHETTIFNYSPKRRKIILNYLT